jgi:hypothetical protein
MDAATLAVDTFLKAATPAGRAHIASEEILLEPTPDEAAITDPTWRVVGRSMRCLTFLG